MRGLRIANNYFILNRFRYQMSFYPLVLYFRSPYRSNTVPVQSMLVHWLVLKGWRNSRYVSTVLCWWTYCFLGAMWDVQALLIILRPKSTGINNSTRRSIGNKKRQKWKRKHPEIPLTPFLPQSNFKWLWTTLETEHTFYTVNMHCTNFIDIWLHFLNYVYCILTDAN